MNLRRIYEPIADDLKAADDLLGSTFGESQNCSILVMGSAARPASEKSVIPSPAGAALWTSLPSGRSWLA